MSKSSQLSKEVSQLLNQVTTAEAKLSHLASEHHDLEKRNQRLQADFDAETAKLLANQEKTLSEARDALESKIGRLREDERRLADEVEALTLRLADREADAGERLNSVEEELGSKTAELSALEADIESALEKSVELEQRTKDQRSALDASQAKLAELHERIDELASTAEEHEYATAAIGSRHTAATEAYEADISTQKANLEVFSAKLAAVRQELKEHVDRMDKERQDIAVRRMALDEREKILAAREYRVRMDEQSIQSNADLINL